MDKHNRKEYFRLGTKNHEFEFQEQDGLSVKRRSIQAQQHGYIMPWRFVLVGLVISAFIFSGAIQYMSDYQQYSTNHLNQNNNANHHEDLKMINGIYANSEIEKQKESETSIIFESSDLNGTDTESLSSEYGISSTGDHVVE